MGFVPHPSPAYATDRDIACIIDNVLGLIFNVRNRSVTR